MAKYHMLIGSGYRCYILKSEGNHWETNRFYNSNPDLQDYDDRGTVHRAEDCPITSKDIKIHLR